MLHFLFWSIKVSDYDVSLLLYGIFQKKNYVECVVVGGFLGIQWKFAATTGNALPRLLQIDTLYTISEIPWEVPG